MSEPVGQRNGLTLGVKVVIGSAVGLLLALGLCGLGSATSNGGLAALGIVGAAVFVLSVIGLIIGILIAIVEGIAKLAGKDKDR